MILIDRAKNIQDIVLTLTELSIDDSPYSMILKSDALRDTLTVTLPSNESTSTSRYDLFKLDTDTFYELKAGYYVYEIYQTDVLIEHGKLLIKDVEIPVEIITPIRDENYIRY